MTSTSRIAAVLLLLLTPLSALAADDLHTAQQLANQKRFPEAESVYRRVLAREPHSRAAILGLGQVLLWEQRYADAARVYRDRLRVAPDDVDARKGLATAEYWSGDFRSAERDYQAVLRSRPSDADARNALAGIAASTAPLFAIRGDTTTDDQPMRRSTGSLSATVFSDPLTSWTAAAGGYALDAGSLGLGRGNASFAEAGVNTSIPSLHLKPAASIRLFRFPDGHVQPLGALVLAHVWKGSTTTLSIDRHELLYTAASVHEHPSETTASLAWSREVAGTSSAATLRAIRYFDGNNGRAADAYHLVPIVSGERATLSLGGAASYRDTDEMRFRLIGASSAPAAGGAFAYSYDARYDPYWTPRKLAEVRGIVAATINAGRAAIHLHADGGWAHDRDLLFGPSTGTARLAPLYPVPLEVSRTFHPWRASADLAIPIAGRTLTVGIERQATVFYRATTVRFGFSGRM